MQRTNQKALTIKRAKNVFGLQLRNHHGLIVIKILLDFNTTNFVVSIVMSLIYRTALMVERLTRVPRVQEDENSNPTGRPNLTPANGSLLLQRPCR